MTVGEVWGEQGAAGAGAAVTTTPSRRVSVMHATTVASRTRGAGRLKRHRSVERLQQAETRTRTNKLHTIATRELLRELVDETNFSFHELWDMVNHFTDVSDVTGSLKVELFDKVVRDHLPGMATAQLATKLFDLMDADKSGSIDFPEFCIGALETVGCWGVCCAG